MRRRSVTRILSASSSPLLSGRPGLRSLSMRILLLFSRHFDFYALRFLIGDLRQTDQQNAVTILCFNPFLVNQRWNAKGPHESASRTFRAMRRFILEGSCSPDG